MAKSLASAEGTKFMEIFRSYLILNCYLPISMRLSYVMILVRDTNVLNFTSKTVEQESFASDRCVIEGQKN